MRERELKLSIGDTFVMPALADDGVGVGAMEELPHQELGSVYHDTADLRLARNGVTLRYRIGDEGGSRWSLKLPINGRDPTEREELTFEGSPAEVPRAARDLVAVWVRHEHLTPAAALSTRRRRWLLKDPQGLELAELVQDDVSVLDGDRIVGRFREIEIESRGPNLDALKPVARALQRAGASPSEPMPKAVRALGARATAAPDVVAEPARPDDPAADVVRASIAVGTRRLIVNDALTRLGDTEGLHQMRVATRRLRADLRTFRSLLDREWAASLAGELKWLGSLLGAVRDRDVQLETLGTRNGDVRRELAPLSAAITKARDDARRLLVEELTRSRYLDLVERLVQAAREPLLVPSARATAGLVVKRLLRKAAKRTNGKLSAVRAGSDDATYHAARIAAKRLRYAAEALGPSAPGRRKRIAAIADAAADLQDLLGSLQDSLVMHAQVRQTVAGRPKDAAFAFAAGRYAERLERERAAVRAAYPRARDRVVRRLDRWVKRA